MDWEEMDVLHKLATILAAGSFGLFILLYLIKRIKEIIEEIRK
jgi:hypothetical protein